MFSVVLVKITQRLSCTMEYSTFVDLFNSSIITAPDIIASKCLNLSNTDRQTDQQKYSQQDNFLVYPVTDRPAEV